MPLTKIQELRNYSIDELKERHAKLRTEYFELTQKKEIGQLNSPHRFVHIRREIAKILTVIGELGSKQEKKS